MSRLEISRRQILAGLTAATGLGERSHLLTPDINLKTHIDDVTSLFHYEDIRP